MEGSLWVCIVLGPLLITTAPAKSSAAPGGLFWSGGAPSPAEISDILWVTMRRKVWIGGGLVALLASVLAVLFLVDFDSPRLGKALLAQVSAQTGLHVEADGFRLNLLRGVRLDGVRFSTEGPSGRLTLKAAGFLAEQHLLTLLRDRVQIDRIVVYEPHIELVTPPENAPAA